MEDALLQAQMPTAPCMVLGLAMLQVVVLPRVGGGVGSGEVLAQGAAS